MTSTARPKVVIVGAGFGGLAAARGLADAPVDVLVIDANNFHTFQPLLYQVATAGLDADDVSYAVRGIFHRQHNVDFLLGRVSAVDLVANTVTVEQGRDVRFDYLVLAAGAVTATYGVPGAEEHAIGLKNLGDALEIRAAVLRRFEEANEDAEGTTLPRGPEALTVAVVGGGPTGVELSGGLQELFTKVLAKDFPRLDVRRARVVLIEGAPNVLGAFAGRLGDRAAAALRRHGVEVLLGTGVERVEPGEVVLADGRRIRAGTIVWAAGVKAGPLSDTPGFERARGGRIVVQDDLTVPGYPHVFAVGDIAASRSGGAPDLLPQVAQPAIQGGGHAAAQIANQLAGAPTVPFRYHDKGSMATIGRNDAVAEFPSGRTLTGFIGWLAWLGLHLLYLIGFRNRVRVLVSWAWNYVTYDRGSRLIGEDLAPRRG
jgi:NADH dehydrogenase